MSSRTYPWYEVVHEEDELLQGDFMKNCPMVPPPPTIDTRDYKVRIRAYNVVVMSQSCDLVEKKIDLVLVCPYWPLKEFSKEQQILRSPKGKEALRRGNFIGHHMLNKCDIPGFELDYLVVDFRGVYSVPFDNILGLAKANGDRLRLLPPYREQLSQAFARFVMRVGLPVDIPAFNGE